MKRTPSVVWRFFDRIEQDGRVVAIVCKLCDARYKYFGNTTNLRCHLVNKHPIQWELGQNRSLEEGFRVAATDDETSPATPRPRQKRYRKTESNDNVRYSISVNKDPNILEGMPIIKVRPFYLIIGYCCYRFCIVLRSITIGILHFTFRQSL